MAIHNHPQPNHYWNPDTEVRVLQGRSKRIGSCADVGHWQRSGVQPIEALKKLEGRIIESHFKDLNEFGNGHDVAWGTGKGNVKGMLAELKRQGYKGYLSIEYEYGDLQHLADNLPKCVAFFDKTLAELAK